MLNLEKSIWHKIRLYTSSCIGIIASLCAIGLWIFLLYSVSEWYDELSTSFFGKTCFGLALPAIIGLYAIAKQKKDLMLVVFVWSFPLSLYLLFSPFYPITLTSFAYLITAIIMPKNQTGSMAAQLTSI